MSVKIFINICLVAEGGAANYQVRVKYSDNTYSSWKTWAEWTAASAKVVDLSLGKVVDSVESRAKTGVSIYAFAVGDPDNGGHWYNSVDESLITEVKVISTGYPNSNTMVVDGGSWGPPVSEPGTNQATKWSTSITSDNEWTYTGLEFGFDNDLATSANASLGVNNTERTLSGFEEYFPNGSGPYKVEVWLTDPISAGVNGGAQVSPSGDGWVTLSSNLDEVRTIKFTASQPVDFRAIRVNDLVLKDGAETAKRVEYQTNGGQGDIISVNTDDNSLLVKDLDSNTRDNRWIAENKAGTDFCVAGPVIVDKPLLTADVELRSTNFATTPENADTLKNIVWELNGTTQDAGLSNPYKPSGLALNTTYTVRVKHQGNDLDDSEWSASTTFTTGATRNLYTYYKERVELLEARLAGIEADEIVDDATDVTLLTAFANLAQRVEALEEGGA